MQLCNFTWLCSNVTVVSGLQTLSSLPPSYFPVSIICLILPPTREQIFKKSAQRQDLLPTTKSLNVGIVPSSSSSYNKVLLLLLLQSSFLTTAVGMFFPSVRSFLLLHYLSHPSSRAYQLTPNSKQTQFSIFHFFCFCFSVLSTEPRTFSLSYILSPSYFLFGCSVLLNF